MRSYPSISREEFQGGLQSFAAFLRQCVVFLFRSIRENWLLFLVINAFCLGGGYYYYQKQPAVYESQMVCAFNNMHKKTFGEMVQRLNHLAATNSHRQLAALLSITETEAKRIKGFDARNIAGSPLHEDITAEKLPLYFTLRAADPDVFPIVQERLLQYLNNSPYRRVRRRLDEEAITQKVAYLDASMQKLDSVILAYTAFLKRTHAVTDSAAGFSNIAALFSYQEQLENKKLEELKQAQLQESIEVVYGFAPTDTPVKKGYSYLLNVLIASLGLSIAATGLKKMMAHG